MTSPQAILIGAMVIAASVLFVNTIRPAEAQRSGLGLGQFMIEHHSNTTANAGVFRIDTVSGEVSYCYLIGTSGDLTCSRGIK